MDHMSRRTRDLPADWPRWSDARPVAEADTLPATQETVWRIGWVRMHAQWQSVLITARRRTTDGGWAVYCAWGLDEPECGWIRWNDRTVRLAEPPGE
jgi:hypothetical protein